MDILAKNRFNGDEEFELGMVMDVPEDNQDTDKDNNDEMDTTPDFSSIKSQAKVIRVSASLYRVVPNKINSHSMIARKLVKANVNISYTEDLTDDNELVNKSENALWNVTSKNGTLFIQRS